MPEFVFGSRVRVRQVTPLTAEEISDILLEWSDTGAYADIDGTPIRTDSILFVRLVQETVQKAINNFDRDAYPYVDYVYVVRGEYGERPAIGVVVPRGKTPSHLELITR